MGKTVLVKCNQAKDICSRCSHSEPHNSDKDKDDICSKWGWCAMVDKNVRCTRKSLTNKSQ